ncbi:MAG: NadS family protein [Rhodanobacteraceae bacterium]
MDEHLFSRLTASIEQMGEIVRGERRPARESVVDADRIREIRDATGLTQKEFANVINVSLDTLRNWEQGRRDPTGPAKALFRAIRNDPKNVLKALA